ncbi:lipid-binding SYLF domain-containing protein [Massilia consociata]|uniref:Lipid-binding SYLF domain-containing protein n=1 Tax=Massilia consociata TaxID=760117 RepID=A0ABV6FLY1_9BURK
MNPTMKRVVATTLVALLAGTTGLATAQVGPAREAGTPGTQRNKEEMKNATEHVNKAVQVVQQMQASQEMRSLLQRSKGVFVVPDYGGAALGVGARGGAGVLLVRNGNTWSNPAFYNMGSLSVGLQAGAEAGAIAFVLNDQKALNSFMQNNKFALNADAGLTLVDWSRKGEGSAGWGNITVWSDTEGLFGGAAINVSDIDYDEDETSAYYQRQVAARDVLTGKVKNPQADMLRQALANASSGSAAASMGGSGTRGTTSGQDSKSESERERSR